MACCENCFRDDELIALIRAEGVVASDPCDHCGSTGGYQIDETELAERFEAVIHHELCLATELTQAPHIDCFEEGERLADLLNQEWDVFSDVVSDNEELLDAILRCYDRRDHEDRGIDTNDLWVRRERDMLHWSASDSWGELNVEIRRLGHSLLRGGVFRGSDDAKRAFDFFVRAVHDVARELDVSVPLFRARRGAGWTGKEIAAPPPHQARAGRANQQGQPVLYLCGDEATSIHEVRPAIGDIVTIAPFALKRSLKVADLASVEYVSPFGSDFGRYLDFRKAADLVHSLGEDLAKPITPSDEQRDYLPTQFLASVVALAGLDGIRFRSAQRRSRDAFNYVLFDPGCAAQAGPSKDLEVESVEYKFGPVLRR